MDTKDLNGPAHEEQSGNERFDTGNSQKTDDTGNHRENPGTDEVTGSEDHNEPAGNKSAKSKHIPDKGDDANDKDSVSEETDESGSENTDKQDSDKPEKDESSAATEPDPEKAGEPGPEKTSGAGYDKQDDTDTEKNDEQVSEKTSGEKPARDVEEYKESVKDNKNSSSGTGNPDGAGSGNPREDQSPEGSHAEDDTAEDNSTEDTPGEDDDGKGKTDEGNSSGNESAEGNEKSSETSGKKSSDNSSSEDKTDEGKTGEEGMSVKESDEDKTVEGVPSVTGQSDESGVTDKPAPALKDPVDYQNMEKEELLRILEELIESKTVQNIRDEVEAIKVSFYKRHKSEIELKRKKFMQEGGDVEAFEPGEDLGEIRFKELYRKYRHSKAAHNRSQEQNKQANLEDKLKVIEDLKELVNRNEDINQTFPEFRNLQKRWHSASEWFPSKT
jgi:hypothetical protein